MCGARRRNSGNAGGRLNLAALAALPALALALNWPYLRMGFVGDDVILLNLLKEGGAPPWWRGLWSVTNLPCFSALWWAGPFDQGGFWRPLPSLLLQASLAVFGEHAFPLHLLAILLHGATAALIALTTTRVFGNARLGLLAGLFFATCEDLSMVVGWVTTLTDVLGTFFVAVALATHVSWLSHRRTASVLFSISSLVLALACKESAVVVPLALAGLTAVVHAPRASGAPSHGHWMTSMLNDRVSWAPGLVVLVVYLAAYKSLGFGVAASELYADPFAEPVEFLRHLVAQAPVLWLATLSPVPPSLAVFVPSTQLTLALLGTAVFGLCMLAWRPFTGEPAASWVLGFYLLAILPQTGAEGSERALYLPLVPGSVMLALLASQAGVAARRLVSFVPATTMATSTPALSRTFAWWVAVGVLVPGLVLSAAYAFVYQASFGLPGRQVASLVSLVEERQPAHVVVLNTSGPFLTFYLGDELSWRVGHRVDTRILSSLNGVLTVERSGDRSITLRTDRRGWLTNMFAMVMRTNTRLNEGQPFRTDLFTATVLEVDAGEPPDARAVRFDLSWPPDARVLAVAWTGDAFVEFDLATLPFGERRRLADTSDVWASMM